MAVCTCIGVCACGTAIVAGVLYYNCSIYNNKNKEEIEDKTINYSMA